VKQCEPPPFWRIRSLFQPTRWFRRGDPNPPDDSESAEEIAARERLRQAQNELMDAEREVARFDRVRF